MRTNEFSNANFVHLLSSIALALPFSTTLLSSAAGQTTLELPGIVVEGATLEVPPPAPRSRPAARTAGPSATEVVENSPATAETSEGDNAEAAAADVAASGIPAAKLGTAVTVITGEELQRRQIRHAADALRGMPGITIGRTGGGFSSKAQVRIRGAEANHTLVLIDGIEANDPNDGEFDFGNLLADDIERIEVIRGPYSGIYGSGAVGGVVNIITKKGKGPLSIRMSSEGGSFGTTHASARISGGNERAWASLSAQQRRSTGFNISRQGNEDDSSNLLNFGLRAGIAIWDGLSVEVVARNAQNRFDRDGFWELEAGGIHRAIDMPAKVANDIWHAGATARWEVLDGKMTHVLNASRSSFDSVDNGLDFGLTRNESESIRYGYTGTYRFQTPSWLPIKHSVSALIRQEDESFTPGSDGIERRRKRFALGGEYRVALDERIFLDGSVRHDDNDTFRDFTTWRTTATIAIPELNIRPHASIGTGVRLPAMFEQFGSIPEIFKPNPNLLPEESFGWDAGLEFVFWQNKASLDITYFRANLTDKIGSDPTREFTLANLPGVSRREGVEIVARVQLSEALSLGAAYTFLEAKDPTGKREPRRPVHSGRVDLDYSFANGKGKITLSALYNGERNDFAFRLVDTEFESLPVTLDDYWLVTAAASYKLEPGVELFGRVENLFDSDYEEIFGYNTPGIAAYAGVRFTLGGSGIAD